MNFADRTECRAVEELLVALAADELESEHAGQLRAHLAECANCQATSAEILRAGELAASLKLSSPEIDRYPEFLRRLAASEVQAQAVVLDSVGRKFEPAGAAAMPVDAGLAAVIPFFGNRVAVRNGFGRGFELSITSAQGNQWLHLSANSLTRVAAVTAGISLVAGISVVALLLIFFSFGKRSVPETQSLPRIENSPPNPPIRERHDAPWIQTASNGERTLAVWKEGTQLQAGLIERGALSLASQFPLNAPLIGNRPPIGPRRLPQISECSLATDGEDFIVMEEVEGAVFLWRIEPQAQSPEKTFPAIAPPILISRKGAQPDVAWIGDRYIAVWVVPDLHSPVIEMIELGSDGRPLQTSATVVARTGQSGKVGLPGVTGANGQVLVTYFVQEGALMARSFTRTDSGYTTSEPAEISTGEGPHHMPVRLLSVSEGYLACWDVMKPEGSEIRMARLDRQGRPLTVKLLARARTPITSFDVQAVKDGQVSLLWSEVQPGGALTFKQFFALDGDSLGPPRNVETASTKPAAVVFGDVDDKRLLWSEIHSPGGQQVGMKWVD